MTSEKATLLLKSLMDGVDPLTGEVLPEDHVCCTPPVMRALHEAILALDARKGSPSEADKEMKSDQDHAKKPDRAGMPWPETDLTRLHEMYRQSCPVKEMAQILRRTPFSIYCRMQRMGMYGDQAGYPRQILPGKKEMPSRLKYQSEISQQDQDTLREMARQGKSISDISAALGRPENSIAARLFYMGLSKEAPVHLLGIEAIDE